MNPNVILTCALTGDGDTVGKSPHVPVTPEQIARDAIAAAEAGAAIVHIHVRDPETGQPSRDLSLYREAVARIRDKGTDVVINLTAGAGGKFVPFRPEESDLVDAMERLAHVDELRPEICSLDCGSMNFGQEDEVYISTAGMVRSMARRIKEMGVKPELEVFDFGHLRLTQMLCQEGLIEPPPFIQFALGLSGGAPAATKTLTLMRDMLPVGAQWVAFGIGAMQFTMAAQSVLLGGHMRVGLEDNLYLRRGAMASNRELVKRAAGIVHALGATLQSPAQARKTLGLGGASSSLQGSTNKLEQNAAHMR